MKKLISLFILFTCLTLSTEAQFLGTFKEIWLKNGDSTLNQQQNGGIYYNETTDRFRFREDGVWRGLGVTTAGTSIDSARIYDSLAVHRTDIDNKANISDVYLLNQTTTVGTAGVSEIVTGGGSGSHTIFFNSLFGSNIEGRILADNGGLVIGYSSGTNPNNYFTFSTSGAEWTAASAGNLINYDADYSSSYDDLDLIQKIYADNQYWNLTEDFTINPSTNNSLVVTGNSNDTLVWRGNLDYKFIAGDGSELHVGDGNLGGGILVQSPRISGVQPDSTGIEFAVDQPANDGMLFYNRLTEDYSMGFNSGVGNMSLAQVNVNDPSTPSHAVTKRYADRQFQGDLTDGAPTDAEIDSATGLNPSVFGTGRRATIKDTTGSGNIYSITSDGSNWYYTEMTQAL